jgi:hypothetical protein
LAKLRLRLFWRMRADPSNIEQTVTKKNSVVVNRP